MPWTLPPAGHVNEGEAVAHEVVAHVDDIIFRKENDGVAVSVARWKMQGANVLTVQVHGDVVVKRDDRQGRLLRGFIFHLHGAAISGHAAGFQALAHIVLCDHRGTRVAEWRIPAGVVAVVVSVNDEAHRLVRNFQILQRGLDFFRQRSELIVHNEDAVLAHGRGDISALAFQHVDVAGNLGRFDLNRGPVWRLLLRHGRLPASQRRANQYDPHPSPRRLAHLAPPQECARDSIIEISVQ